MSFLKLSNENKENLSEQVSIVFAKIRENLYRDYSSIAGKYYIVFKDVLQYGGIEGRSDAIKRDKPYIDYEKYLQDKYNERFHEENWIQKTLLKDEETIKKYIFSDKYLAMLMNQVKNI